MAETDPLRDMEQTGAHLGERAEFLTALWTEQLPILSVMRRAVENGVALTEEQTADIQRHIGKIEEFEEDIAGQRTAIGKHLRGLRVYGVDEQTRQLAEIKRMAESQLLGLTVAIEVRQLCKSWSERTGREADRGS